MICTLFSPCISYKLNMPFRIVRNDITKMNVDAIVNAANTSLEMGGGVCGSIFTAAGEDELKAACEKIGRCETGCAVLTNAYALNAKYIIHTAGPVWQGGDANETATLRSCYTNSLALAEEKDCKSIAFPLISSGVYGYPKDYALNTAISAIAEFLKHNEMMVYLVVFDKTSYALSEKLFFDIERFIDDHYVDAHENFNRRYVFESQQMQAMPKAMQDSYAPHKAPSGCRKLEDVVNNLDETFANMLLRLIDEKGLTDVETYKRANIDRKLFSKIRSNPYYNPSKTTAIAFAIALSLNLDQTRDLLGKAGYTLSHSSKFDVIIEYFIKEGNFNIYEINEALFAFDQSLLGA